MKQEQNETASAFLLRYNENRRRLKEHDVDMGQKAEKLDFVMRLKYSHLVSRQDLPTPAAVVEFVAECGLDKQFQEEAAVYKAQHFQQRGGGRGGRGRGFRGGQQRGGRGGHFQQHQQQPELCRHFYNNGACKFGDGCHFVHTRPGPQGQQQQQGGKGGKGGGKGKGKNPQCYKCLQFGHIAPNCSQQPQQQPQPTAQANFVFVDPSPSSSQAYYNTDTQQLQMVMDSEPIATASTPVSAIS
jgi:hypothetical protein